MVSLYRQGKMTGGLYRCLGQEATAVGTAFALEEGDLLVPVIRDLGATLVRGARPVDILRQVMTKGNSPARGRDGFLHFCLPEKGLYSGIAMLGTAVSVVAGMVLADRFLGKRTVGMTYLGEGGTSTGAFHEGINFAAVQRLPLVVVLEFNRFSYSTPSEMQCGAATLADKAAGYGVASAIVDGNDVLAVVEAARRAVAHARGGAQFALHAAHLHATGLWSDAEVFANAMEVVQNRALECMVGETDGLVEQSLLGPMYESPSAKRTTREVLRITRQKVEEVLGLPSHPISAAG